MAEYLLMAEHPGVDGEYHISGIRGFSDEEMAEYRAAYILLIDFHSGFALFDICKRNYTDLENTIRDIRATDKINRQDAYEHSVEANRKIINYLASFRTFIDHQETVLKRTSDVQYYELFRKRAGYHYDTWFSYRFLWQMRNYVQHCGLPLGGIERRLVSDVDGNPKIECFVYFDKEKLLSTYSNWGKIHLEIENLPNKIDIMENVEQLSLCINEIALYSAEIATQRLGTRWNFIANLVNEVRATFPVSNPCLGTKTQEGVIHISNFPILAIENLQKAWEAMAYLNALKAQGANE